MWKGGIACAVKTERRKLKPCLRAVALPFGAVVGFHAKACGSKSHDQSELRQAWGGDADSARVMRHARKCVLPLPGPARTRSGQSNLGVLLRLERTHDSPHVKPKPVVHERMPRIKAYLNSHFAR